MRGGALLKPQNYLVEDTNQSMLAPSTCVNGQYFHNNENSSARMLAVCQSGKNRATFEYT